MKFTRVNKKNPCRFCGKNDYCGVAPNGEFAICMRESSPVPARNGGWIHFLIERDSTPIAPRALKPAVVKQEPSRRPVGALDEVYTRFLQHLVLSNNHRQAIRDRGIDLTDIALHGYKSAPTSMMLGIYAERLGREYELRGVPGFYRDGAGRWRFVDYGEANGFYIPIRDAGHRIVGLQLRRDDSSPKYMMCSSTDRDFGTNSGTPAHHARLGLTGPRSSVTSIIITEGPLKANIIAARSRITTIGLIGVGCFDEEWADELRRLYPNCTEVSIAFDMDAATNPAVRQQRDRLQLTLQKIKFNVRILSWNPAFKGFDDYLVAGAKTGYAA